MFTYTRFGRRLVRVDLDGVWQGWLMQTNHKTTGLNAQRYMVWSGAVSGVEFRATTLTAIKAKINAAFIIETVYEGRYDENDNVKENW